MSEPYTGDMVAHVTVGRFMCGTVRDYLRAAQIKHGIVFVESGGWLERIFTYRGTHVAMAEIARQLQAWQDIADRVY